MTIFPPHGSTASDDTLTNQRLCQLIAKAGNPSLGVQEMVTKFELQGQEGMVRKIIQNYGYQFIQSTGHDGIVRYRLVYPDQFL